MTRIAVVLILCWSAAAFAEQNRVELGFGGGGIITLAPWSYDSGPGVELHSEILVRAAPTLALVARAHHIEHVESLDGSGAGREVGVLVGVRVAFTERVFATVAAGFALWWLDGDPFAQAIGVPLLVSAGASVTREVAVELGLYTPDILLGGLHQFESGAHNSKWAIGPIVTATYTFGI